jgi:hypothetical protein
LYKKPIKLIQLSSKHVNSPKTFGQRHYELSFGTMAEGYDDGSGHGPGAEIIIKTPALTYVNWKSDIICPFPARFQSWIVFTQKQEDVIHNDLDADHYHHRIHRIAIDVKEVEFAIDLLRPKSHCLEEIILCIAPSRLTDLSYDDKRPITIEFDDLDVEMDTKLSEALYGVDAMNRLQEAKFDIEFAAEVLKERPEWKCPTINLMHMKVTGV